MVAELLRLKARLLRNGFRRAPAGVFGRILLFAIAVVGLVALFRVASNITALDGAIVGRVVALGGAEITLAVLLLPAMFGRMQLLDPRAFYGYNVRPPALAGLILLVTLLGPALLLVVLVFVPVIAWSGFAGASRFAVGAALLLIVQLLLLLRIGVALGAWLRSRSTARSWVRLLGTLLLLGGLATIASVVLPRVVLLAPERELSFLAPVVRVLEPLHAETVADRISGSPLASLWGAPALAASGSGDPGAAIWIGVAVIAALALIWWGIVAASLRPTRRLNLDRVNRVPAWFRLMPANAAGAVAARSFIYWIRDPRYRVVFGILPILPVVTIVAFAIGGVPIRVGALVPLALMVLVLAWSTIHNDIAYDSTAVWSHLAAQTRGSHDRFGRIWPVIFFGAILIAIGTPITVWAQGDPDSLPAVLGINIALLLGGVGVGSGMSPRYPYPTPRPGDGPFTFPQASGGTGGGAQGASFFFTIVVAAPAIAATVLWMFGWIGGFNWIALLVGVLAGLIALAIGIQAGGRVFDRRGPEILAFTMQN